MAFSDTLARWVEGIDDAQNRLNIRKLIEPLFDRMSTSALNSAGLAITGGGGTAAKIGASDFYAMANGVLVKIAASTTLPTLVGTITASSFNVFCFFVDSAATATVAMGTEGTTIGKIVFPQMPKQKALIGFILVTCSATFTGGTTALDGSTTTVYLNSTESFDPACLLGY